MDSLKYVHTYLDVFIAGAVGAFLGSAFRGKEGIAAILLSIPAGFATSYYFGPLILHWLSLGTEFYGPVGFIAGLTGMSIVNGIIKAGTVAGERLSDVVEKFFSKKFPNKKVVKK